MKLNERIYEKGLVQVALENDGVIKPLLIKFEDRQSVAIMNPSIINENNQLLFNLRCTNYTLWHSETRRYNHLYGPLQYIHPTHTPKLKTINYLGLLDENLDIIYSKKINMKLDKYPKWNFHGLEDARLVIWNDQLYITGCRRDTTDNGQSRMELSRIDWHKGNPVEVERLRIPAPDEDSYCEKNWMPILDRPFQWIKWTNPTELVLFDKINNKVTSSILSSNENFGQVRGGTQVIKYRNKYIAIGHIVEFRDPKWGEKDARYYANLIIWDEHFNLEYISKPFKLLDAGIEFQCGMCIFNDSFLITFSCTDNAAYVIKIKTEVLLN